MNLLTLLFDLLILTGCASIVTDMEDIPIRVTTNPPGAIVEANANTYVTPASILLPRGQGDLLIVTSKSSLIRSPYWESFIGDIAVHEIIRSRVALWVFQLNSFPEEKRVAALKTIRGLSPKQIEELTVQILDRGLETMSDLSLLG